MKMIIMISTLFRLTRISFIKDKLKKMCLNMFQNLSKSFVDVNEFLFLKT